MDFNNLIIKSVSTNPDTSIVAQFIETLETGVRVHEIIFYPENLSSGIFPSLLRQSTYVREGSFNVSNDGWLIYCTVDEDGIRVVEPLGPQTIALFLSIFMRREARQIQP